MWDKDSLWRKAKNYLVRANEVEDPDRELYPLWCALAFEFLGRAALAHVHPCLLADTKQGHHQLLHALGRTNPDPARSLGSIEVFKMCERVIPEFTKKDTTFCATLLGRRNVELHTGEEAFVGLKTSVWLPDYYRLCQILCGFMEQSLTDLLGKRCAKAATLSISALEDDRKKEANELIQAAKTAFEALDLEERLEKAKDVGFFSAFAQRELLGLPIGAQSRNTKCPSCGAEARVYGTTVRESPARAHEEGEFGYEATHLPIMLHCRVCALRLDGYNLLHSMGLGDEWTTWEELDPAEHFEIETMPEPDDYD